MPSSLSFHKLHARFHYGRDRALNELNRTYTLNNVYARELLSRIKEQCPSCHRRLDMPKNPPDTPITSMDFGERILVDLKQLPRGGYMIVAICHWSSYCWLGLIATKHADGVAKFLDEVVFADVKRIRAGWKKAREESEETRQGGVSFPRNPEEPQADTTASFFTISVNQDHRDMLQVCQFVQRLASRVCTCRQLLLYLLHTRAFQPLKRVFPEFSGGCGVVLIESDDIAAHCCLSLHGGNVFTRKTNEIQPAHARQETESFVVICKHCSSVHPRRKCSPV